MKNHVILQLFYYFKIMKCYHFKSTKTLLRFPHRVKFLMCINQTDRMVREISITLIRAHISLCLRRKRSENNTKTRWQLETVELLPSSLWIYCSYCESHLQDMHLIPCTARNPRVKQGIGNLQKVVRYCVVHSWYFKY